MPAYLDEKRNTWYCKFYYTTYTGEKKQKIKRGFSRKKDAQQWEREFLLNVAGSPDITFETLCTSYLDYLRPRLKESTMHTKEYIINTYIGPYFNNRIICEVTSLDVALWQNELLQKNFSPTFSRSINVQLIAIFNFAVKYKGLSKSPCIEAIGRSHRDSKNIDFWTLEEYKRFIAYVDNIGYRTLFDTLYYSGMRIGELLALTPADILFSSNEININKTFRILKNQEHTTPPKTENSIRKVPMPAFVMDELKEYMAHVYVLKNDYRLFFYPSSTITWYKNTVCQKNSLRQIRIHDFRHSHVSMLVNLNCSLLLVAERIGDTTRTVQEVYAHLYPNQQADVVKKIETLVSQ